MRRSCFLLLVVVVASPSIVSAETRPEKARKLAQAAIKISEGAAGDPVELKGAIELFKSAYALDPRPAYQCSIAIGYQEIGDLARAHLFLSRCLPGTAEGQRKTLLEKNQAALTEAMEKQGLVSATILAEPATAELQVPDIDSEQFFSAPLQLWLGPGEHVVKARLEGYIEGEQTLQVESSPLTTTIRLEKEPVVLPTTQEDKEPTPVEPEPTLTTPPAPEDGPLVSQSQSPKSKVPMWIAYGGAMATGAGSVWFFTRALSARREIVDTHPIGDAYDDLHDQVRRNEIISYSLGAVAIGAAAAGTYFFLDSGSEDASLALIPQRGGAMVSWSVRR